MSTCCCDPECWEPVPVISGLFFLRCLADVFVYRASVIEPKPIIVEGKKCPVHGFKYYLGLQSFDVLHKGKDRVVQPIHISGPGVVTKDGPAVILPFATNSLVLTVDVAEREGGKITSIHQSWTYNELADAVNDHKRIDVWL